MAVNVFATAFNSAKQGEEKMSAHLLVFGKDA
jgi:hypothetical protein